MESVDTAGFDPQTVRTFWVGPAAVEPALHQIRRDGRLHKLEPRVMRVLLCLAARPGRPVTREELLDAVWTDGLANDEGLTQAVCKLRKAFSDRATQATVIENIPKVGYRLIAPVSAQPIAMNNHPPISSNGQVQAAPNGWTGKQEDRRERRQAPPRTLLSPATLGFGYRETEWRWLAVCFALLIVFCALWLSYFAQPPAPAQQHQRVLIHRLGSDATGPHGTMKIVVRKLQMSPDAENAPLEWNQQTP